MRLSFISISMLLCGMVISETARAQATDTVGDGGTDGSTPEVAKVPFGVGERFEYRVRFGPLTVGEAVMEVTGIDTVAGHPTYHLSTLIEGSVPFYTLKDIQESWLDVSLLASRRFRQDSKQGDYERQREYQFDLENRVYHEDNGETDSIPPLALDEASFIYFVRATPLEVGETYEWNRYFRFDRNPVIVQVLRREKVKVPAGEFETVVVRPIIKTGGIFAEGGEAEVYMTDDEGRLLIKLVSKLKVGTLTMELTNYEAGEPLTPEDLEGEAASSP
ncbi:MAG: DUF3108 domain-containing protein [Gemmatimonadetes bacterium]|nr:DUF3108 domain-containing protein [Gemmatimonadota bacterium]